MMTWFIQQASQKHLLHETGRNTEGWGFPSCVDLSSHAKAPTIFQRLIGSDVSRSAAPLVLKWSDMKMVWCCCGLGWLCHCICIASTSNKTHYNKSQHLHLCTNQKHSPIPHITEHLPQCFGISILQNVRCQIFSIMVSKLLRSQPCMHFGSVHCHLRGQ